jgi:DNA-binding transcriptional LysR family regulator
VFNSAGLWREHSKGFGLACLTEGCVQPYMSLGRLVRVLPGSNPDVAVMKSPTRACDS